MIYTGCPNISVAVTNAQKFRLSRGFVYQILNKNGNVRLQEQKLSSVFNLCNTIKEYKFLSMY